jgi:endo-1,3-1,4-beta-glycanase ExoK
VCNEREEKRQKAEKMKSYQHHMKYSVGALVILLGGLTFIFSGAHLASAEESSFFLPYPKIDLKKWYISNGWSNGEHQSCEWRENAISGVDGALQLRLSDKGGLVRPIGCAEIHTYAHTGYGRYEARMRTAAGSGLNTAFFTYVGPPQEKTHDEIDFEFIGKAPNTVDLTVWTNGQSSGSAKRISLGFDASKDFHDYAFEWRPESIRWYADGKLIYETPKDAPIPSHPGSTFFSLWSGSKIEDEWMGHFTYTIPVAAEVASTKFTPFY